MLGLKRCSGPCYVLAITVNSMNWHHPPPQILVPRNAALEGLASSTALWEKNRTHQWSTSPFKPMVSFALPAEKEALLFLQWKVPHAWLCPSVACRVPLSLWHPLGNASLPWECEGSQGSESLQTRWPSLSTVGIFQESNAASNLLCKMTAERLLSLHWVNSIRHICHCRAWPAWWLI